MSNSEQPWKNLNWLTTAGLRAASSGELRAEPAPGVLTLWLELETRVFNKQNPAAEAGCVTPQFRSFYDTCPDIRH